jgi:cell division protein FtsB
MATTGRSRGPASRPPRRPSRARPATGRTSAGPSRTASSGASPRAATTGGAHTARVVRRTASGWWRSVAGAVGASVTRRVAVLASIAVFLVLLLGSTVAAWVHQSSQISALRDTVAAQERDVAELKAEQERWTDPAYVEQQARQRLKFVRPGEKSYTVLDPAPRTRDDLAGTDVAQPREALPWFQAVWQSARTADAPGAGR